MSTRTVKRGIDISSWQESIDLTTLKNKGYIDFVMIRVGYGVSGTIDAKFKRNADLCKELGIPIGFYWYSYALNVDEAKTEANHFLKAIAPYSDDVKMGCWIDMEDADGFKKTHGMPSYQILKDMCYNFCEIVENAGYYAGVYASQSWFNNQLSGNRLARFDKWVAQWPTHMGKQKGLDTSPNSNTHNYSLWQFTSKGQFPDFPGKYDVNYAYHEFPNPKTSQTPAPAPAPAPTPTPAPAPAITKGSRVRFTGIKSYSGIRLAAWTHNDVFNVIEVSGNRVVIGKGSVVTAAVNIKDCVLL